MASSLEKVLSVIDKLGSRKNREILKFLAKAITSETLSNDSKIPSTIYSFLTQMISSDNKTLPILKHMLLTARYDKREVTKLDSLFINQYSFSMPAAVLKINKKLLFYELLLVVSFIINDHPKQAYIWRHMLDKIPKEKLKVPKCQITSVFQLFTSMRNLEPDTLDSELVQPWSELKDIDVTMHMVVDDVKDVVSRCVKGNCSVHAVVYI